MNCRCVCTIRGLIPQKQAHRPTNPRTHLADDVLELRLVDHREEPAEDVGELRAVLGGHDDLVGVHQRRGAGDVGQRHLLAHQVRLVREVRVDLGKRRRQVRLGLFGHSGGVGQVAEDGIDPERGGELQLVGREVDPGVHQARLEEGGPVQARVPAEARHVARDGVGLEERALGRLQHRHLARGRLGGHVLALLGQVHVHHLDVHAVVQRRHQDLERPEVARVRVQLLLDRGGGWVFGGWGQRLVWVGRVLAWRGRRASLADLPGPW